MNVLNTAELCLSQGEDGKFYAMHVFSQFVKKKKKGKQARDHTVGKRSNQSLNGAQQTPWCIDLPPGTQGPSLRASSPTSPARR